MHEEHGDPVGVVLLEEIDPRTDLEQEVREAPHPELPGGRSEARLVERDDFSLHREAPQAEVLLVARRPGLDRGDGMRLLEARLARDHEREVVERFPGPELERGLLQQDRFARVIDQVVVRIGEGPDAEASRGDEEREDPCPLETVVIDPGFQASRPSPGRPRR